MGFLPFGHATLPLLPSHNYKYKNENKNEKKVACRGYIRSHRYDTSYNCLARRAARTNNVWNRIIRRGSVARRISVYGALQLGYTLICLAVFGPTYYSRALGAAMQVCFCVCGVPVFLLVAGGRCSTRQP